MTGSKFTRRQVAGSALAAAGLVLAPRASALQRREPTPESPMGPFYPIARLTDSDADLTQIGRGRPRAQGTIIEVTGRVLDQRGNPVSGAVMEMWQCNAAGRYAHDNDPATAPLDPNFQGFARIRSGRDGGWRLTTIKPAGYNSPIGFRPPHLHWDLAGRRDRRIAQMYFPEDAEANARDELYRGLGTQGPLSVARRDSGHRYVWDVILAEA